MEDYLGKQYVVVSTENLDEYLAFTGINYLLRKAATAVKPVLSLIKNADGTYTLKMSSSFVNTETTFTPGVEFDETRGDDSKTKSIVTFDGNVMTHVQIEGSGRKTTHIREFYPDKLIISTSTVGFDKTMKRICELVK